MIKIAIMLALWLMLQGCKPVNQDKLSRRKSEGKITGSGSER